MSWLEDMTQRVADVSGVDVGSLTLTPNESTEILDIARIASHSSGDRINAPLLCYVIGMARANGASLEDIARIVREGVS
jgi:hypothetical protein